MDPTAVEPAASPAEQPTPTIRRWGWMFAAPWLLFLVIQVVTLIQSDRPRWQVTTAITLMVLFAVCFMTPFVAYSSATLGGLTRRTLAWAPMLLMVLIIGVSVPLMSWSTTAYIPYLVAYLAFHTPTRIAMPIAAFALVAMTVTLWLGGVLDEMIYIVVVVALTAVANFTSVVMIQRTSREEELLAEQARLREQDRLGRDLHDLLGHSLTVIALKAELAEALAEKSPAAAKAELTQIRELTRDALTRVRFTVGQMRNSSVSEEIAGLKVSFAGTGTELEVTGEAPELSPRLQQVLGWIVREAGTNVLRHARATRCRIEWTGTGVRIIDDGVGIPSGGAGPSGNGVRNMTARATEVGARVSIGPGPDGGTSVEVTW